MFKLFGVQKQSPSRLIEGACRDVSTMLQQAGTMFDHALAALLDNQPLRVDLEDLDDVVDEGERMVRRSVLEHLSVDPQHDLLASLLLVSMVQDAERIGDFARGLAELVPLARRPREGEYNERLRRIAAELRPLFAATQSAFRGEDPDQARSVMATAQRQKRELLAYTADVAQSDLSADMAVVYSGAARILRRIGSHLSNICSTVNRPYDRIRRGDQETT